MIEIQEINDPSFSCKILFLRVKANNDFSPLTEVSLQTPPFFEFNVLRISLCFRATQRTHPYQRPSNNKSPTPENSILLSVLSNKCSPKPSYSNHESNHQEAEFKLDIQSLPSLLPIQCSNTSLTVKDAMSDLDTLVWSMADAEIEQVSQRLNIPRSKYFA